MKIPTVRVLIFLYFLFAVLFIPKFALAADFKTDFKVEYYLKEIESQLVSDVKFSIKITHLRSDTYVKKFSLSFPKYFSIKNISASDDNGKIEPVVQSDSQKSVIELEFSSPKTGKDTVNNFYIDFSQDNLFKVNGNVWEVMLPVIENQSDGDYTMLVNLPLNTDKKISIAKPKPDYVSGKQLIWNNPTTKTIYAVFGDKQYYQSNLIYNLINPKIYPVYTDIALPPDTLYQKVFIDQLVPQPNSVSVDSDGNYLARYNLKPKESKTIVFQGIIGIYASPRSELRELNKNQIKAQEKYLLTEKSYWQINEPDKFSNLKNVGDIYNYVVNNLTYDYQKLNTKEGRIGANNVLKNPTKAVCTEFTDLFIGLAREKGIYSREIQGYGFSADPQLRPMSFVSDTLHSWPEYYDATRHLWQAVDPTWENTSGIDYFSSFDLNHITFTIHGNDPSYPYPAGMYKTKNSKDIIIQPVSYEPKDNNRLKMETVDFQKVVYYQKKYHSKIIISNIGNVFLYNQKIKISDHDLDFTQTDFMINQIAPYQQKEIAVEYSPKKVIGKKNSLMTITLDGQLDITKLPVAIYPYYYDLILKFGYISAGLMIIIVILRYVKRSN